MPDHSPVRGAIFWKASILSGQNGSGGLKKPAGGPRRLIGGRIMGALRAVIPDSKRRWLWAVGRLRPAIGRVQFGQLRRLSPISRYFGWDRGVPIDRHYIETFLAQHQDDVKGHVLEIGDPNYSKKYGGEKLRRIDVLNIDPDCSFATIIADLSDADVISSNTFDCIILTQTLQFIYDVGAAVRTLHRILRPGGVLLATVPGITQSDPKKWKTNWYWSFTDKTVSRLFADEFSADFVDVRSYGNVLSATSLLYGLSLDELRQHELEHVDSQYPVIISIRAQKALKV